MSSNDATTVPPSGATAPTAPPRASLRPTVVAGGVVLALLGAYALGGRTPAAHAAVATTAPATSSAPTGGSPTGIAVDGVGTATTVPNVVRVSLSVSQSRGDVSSALSAADGALRPIAAALRSRGVAAKDISTTNVSVQEDWSNVKNGEKPTSYVASESLDVTLRDVGKAGAAISAAVNAGGNGARLDSVVLDVDGDTAAQQQARTAAFADAKARAETYAAASGHTLGAVTYVSESVDAGSPVPYAGLALAAGAPKASSVPLQLGSAQVSVTVHVVWTFG